MLYPWISHHWASTCSLLVALIILVYWLSWRWKNRRLLELARQLPGPVALPLIGNALLLMASPEKLLKNLSAPIQEYGDYMRLWLGPELMVCVKNPADIRSLLTSNKVSEKGPSYRFMVPFIGGGILAGGPTWRLHRKLATPAYSKKCVQHFATVFNQEAELLVQVLLRKDPQKTFNIFPDVLVGTTQSVCQTLLGLSKEESLEVPHLKELMTTTIDIYTLIWFKMTRWFYQVPLIYRLMGLQKAEDNYKACADEFAAAIVAKRKAALSRECLSSTESNENMGAVDRFILSGELNDKELKHETFTIFTTSQEAAAKIASGVLLFLAHLPEWQDKVYNEIIEVLGSEDTFVSAADVKKLVYLEAVYKEVIRYLAIAAIIQRTVTEEVTISDGKITLPVGTTLTIPLHELHRDPGCWPEPNSVKPERFLPGSARERDSSVYMPFSLGPMDCLGRVFATAMIKIMVIRVLRNVVFEADGALEDLDLHVAISVRFAKGYNLRAKPRHKEMRIR